MMTILQRHAAMMGRVRAADSAGQLPVRVTIEAVISPTEVVINGQRTVTAGTHNYLGLSLSEACMEAAIEAVRIEGTGTCGSRLEGGSFAHGLLEKEIADCHRMKHCMIFTTGYQANLGIVSALVGEGDHLIIDADSHASIYDACKQTKATAIRFRHNDVENLRARLRRLQGQPGEKLVVVEGIYSMIGDTAPLRAILDVAHEFGAYVLVDEAHSFGVLGEAGCGLAEALGVLQEVDFIVGTFSKSLGAVGGYCVSNLDGFDVLRLASHAYRYTASLPPSVVASVRETLKTIEASPHLRRRLWDNINVLYGVLKAGGYKLGPDPSPIVAVFVPSPEIAMEAWRMLLSRGFYVNIGIPPATPNGESLLRCAVCAEHSPDQLEALAQAILAVGRELQIVSELKPHIQ